MKKWPDENEKLVEKFFACLWRAKKEFPIFSPEPGFFVVEALKNRQKPLNFQQKKTTIFGKKGPQNFFACGGFFFKTLVGRFNEIGWTKEGEGSKTYFTLPSITYSEEFTLLRQIKLTAFDKTKECFYSLILLLTALFSCATKVLQSPKYLKRKSKTHWNK